MVSSEEKCEVTFLQKMREDRELSTAAFIEFTSNYRKIPEHAFCFFEGEDKKYYNLKIEAVLGEKIYTIICGNKIETLKIWRRLTNDPRYISINKMFFVDRDMDLVPDDKDQNLYITPCYSIENLYVNEATFKKILQVEFSLNQIEQDFQKCIKLFEKLLKDFHEQIIEFNACVLLRQRKSLGNGAVPLKDFKVSRAFNIDLSGISQSSNYNEQINKLRLALKVDEDEIQKAIQELNNIGDFGNIFRGKNQLDFMVQLLNLLKQANSESRFFETKRNSVTLNITKNRLSELSQYALFPQCLKFF